LSGGVQVDNQGQPQRLVPGRHEFAVDSHSCCWHDTVAYGLLQPAEIVIEHGPKTGSWYASSHSHPNKAETRDLFTAWIDHGTKPDNASYAYVVAPGAADTQALTDAAGHPVSVLSNTAKLQAVSHSTLGLTAAAFYSPDALDLPESRYLPGGASLRVDTPCLLLARATEDGIELTLANPKNLPARIELQLTCSRREPQTLSVDLPDGHAAGSSVSAIVPQ